MHTFPMQLPSAGTGKGLGMTARIHFRGPARYRLRSAAELSQSILEASARRAFKGPRLPGWNWFVELATEMLKRQTLTALQMNDVKEARRYLDSVVFSFTRVVGSKHYAGRAGKVQRKLVYRQELAGKNEEPRVSVLYFHGGGYSFYPQAYANFIALITQAAKSRTFALDYRLSPEHRFPAQLDDAVNAYRWLLETGVDPERLIVAGDSAGGNLTLALLLAARESETSAASIGDCALPAHRLRSRHHRQWGVRLD